ncbi:hypothetical protein CU669_06860 [Paramagnetospirillum kuznetsovii]|uniref:Uncharacterized protein n=1 Tax=Paramagnetospirillum kuznetsovii TaxID=2053833 RepID=A0A364NZC2_9PROT|nr:hypothetical protein [Paramagnetospirillum kuznetsovii]RAU22424.1 hypothetical protein CU669_06860 [Paramagnetospirillum kuznetsovii]
MGLRIRELPRPAGFTPTPFPVGSAADRSALAGLVAMIENNPAFCNRGVLPEEQERCYRAVVDAKRLVADTAELLPPGAPGLDLLTAIGSACRKYVSEADSWDRRTGRRYQMPTFVFFQLLGAFRELLGMHVWRLAEAYDLEIEGRLNLIFPGAAD